MSLCRLRLSADIAFRLLALLTRLGDRPTCDEAQRSGVIHGRT